MRPEGEPLCLAGRALPLRERRNHNYADSKAILPQILGAQSTQQLSEPFSLKTEVSAASANFDNVPLALILMFEALSCQAIHQRGFVCFPAASLCHGSPKFLS